MEVSQAAANRISSMGRADHKSLTLILTLTLTRQGQQTVVQVGLNVEDEEGVVQRCPQKQPAALAAAFIHAHPGVHPSLLLARMAGLTLFFKSHE